MNTLEQTVNKNDNAEAAMEKEEPAYIRAARRAPSAHNAQPWRLYPLSETRYRLCYAYADKLQADPDDRDALLSIGAFFETLNLAANLEGKRAIFEAAIKEQNAELQLGFVNIEALPENCPIDHLAPFVRQRQTNRHKYEKKALPDSLKNELTELGCLLLEPKPIASLVNKASIMAWEDRRFVEDLKEWTRLRGNPPDGMTVECLNLSWTDRQALRFALWRGRLGKLLAWVYAQRDVNLTKHSSQIAVLYVDEREPLALFECGRRLLRAWVAINGAGYAYHPISIVIDQPTANELATLANVQHPVAIFRVGCTNKEAAWSNRRSNAVGKK